MSRSPEQRKSAKDRFAITSATLGTALLAFLLWHLPYRVPNTPGVGRDVSAGKVELRGRRAAEETDAALQSRLSGTYGRLPLHFEANAGQTNERANFISRGNGYSLFLTPTESVMQLRRPSRRDPCDRKRMRTPCAEDSVVLRSVLLNSNESAKAEGLDELPGKSNYFVGKDRGQWEANVANYARVKYGDVYPGIDVIYYGNQRQLEHDFVVAPGGVPQDITIRLLGAEGIDLDAGGDLVIHTALGDVKQKRPVIYQESEGGRREVAGSYVIKGGFDVGFRVGDYDRDSALVIDPVLTYSTYLGGSEFDLGGGIAVDSEGQVVVAGSTGSTDFPVYNGYQSVNVNGEAFVTKLNAAGTAILYSTFLGGGSEERVTGLTVDGAGNSYITGFTYSDDFPTVNAFSPSKAGQFDVFVAKMNDTGSSLLYSSYLGGGVHDFGFGVAADDAGNVYVTGITDSTNFPTVNALKTFLGGSRDGFVAKFDTNQAGPQSLTYSSYVGGNGGGDYCEAIAVDPSGKIYVTGRASELSFPLKNAYQNTDDPYGTAFVTKLDPTLSGAASLLYSSYFGGSGGEEIGYGIAADASGRAYITGSTWSTDFPVRDAFQPTYSGNNGVSGHNDAFVTIFDTTLTGDASLLYSTYLGGNHEDLGRSIKVDDSGAVYVVGDTSSSNFPTKDAIQNLGYGRTDAFITKLKPFVQGDAAILFSTYLGGGSSEQGNAFALDDKGGIYVTGNTESTDFPTMNPLQASFKGATDAFVVKLFAASNHGALHFAQPSYSVGEGAGSVTLSVTREGGSDGAVSVQYTTNDGTATSGGGGDYAAQGPATLSWAAGDSAPREITISIKEDAVFEGAEQFAVVLSNPTGGASVDEPSGAAVEIVENDAAPVFGFQSLGQDEGNGFTSSFGVFVTKTGNTAVSATLDYRTVPGTATPGAGCNEPGVDYVPTSGTLTFLPQETSKLLFVVVCGGTEPEPDETFSVPFVNPVNGRILPGTGTSNFFISNDDKYAPTVVANLAGYTYDGTAHAASGSATGNDGATLSPAVTFTYSGTAGTNYPASSTPPSAAGTYQVVANFAGNNNYTAGSSAPVPYTISKASSTTDITFEAGPYVYRGSVFTATATVSGAGGLDSPLTVVYEGDCANVTTAGGCTATAVYAGDRNHAGGSDSKSITITQAAASIEVQGYAGTYDGQAHGAAGSAHGVEGESLTGLLDLGATFTNAPGGTAHWTFAGNNNYAPSSGDATVSIGKAAQLISWSNPAAITYGRPLSASQLNATVSAVGPSPPGGLSYSPAGGTLLHAGAHRPLTVSAAATDNYEAASMTVYIDVAKATPVINWSDPAAVTYGVALGAAQLNATAAHPADGGQLGGTTLNGAFAYTPPAGTVLPAGNNSLSVVFTPSDSNDYTTAAKVVMQRVNYGVCALYDQTKAARSGSTIPVKLTLCGLTGANLSSPGIVLTAIGTRLLSPDAWGDVEDAGGANPDMNFRFTTFDAATPGYIFNLQTKGFSTGVYQLGFYVGSDPTVYTVQFQVK